MPAHVQLAPMRGGYEPARSLEGRIRIVLADDHAAMRRSLRLVLDGEADFEVVAEASDLSTVMRHVPGHLPHVLVLDLGMPNGSSIEAIGRLRAQVPETEIVVLTLEESPAFAERALTAGAVGFVVKDRADAELPEAVRRAARGERYLSPPVASRLAAMDRSGAKNGLRSRGTEVYG